MKNVSSLLSGTSLKNRFVHFWFEPISITGFGLMRMAFGFTAFITMFAEWSSVELYYGPSGLLPRDVAPTILRGSWHFTLLQYADTSVTSLLYLGLLTMLALVTIGLWTKRSLLAALILLFSFHEYGTITLDSGDTLQRLVGFILLLSPCGKAMSVDALRLRLSEAKKTGQDIDVRTRTMPIWPYRLLLWQVILLYSSSAIEKWSGTTWIKGSAVAITLHHAHFSRLSTLVADKMTLLSPAIGDFTLVTQSMWCLLLVVPLLVMFGALPQKSSGTLKRALILAGALTHGGILLLMDVGTFSLIVFTAYVGLLKDDDFEAMRAWFNRKNREKTVILFDGRCGLCSAMIIILRSFDWLKRLAFENYHDPVVREKYAEGISINTLDEAMHVRSRGGSMTKGFYGFRSIAKQVPPLWILVPLLSVPGVPFLGEKVYGWVARHR